MKSVQTILSVLFLSASVFVGQVQADDSVAVKLDDLRQQFKVLELGSWEENKQYDTDDLEDQLVNLQNDLVDLSTQDQPAKDALLGGISEREAAELARQLHVAVGAYKASFEDDNTEKELKKARIS